MTVLTAKSNNVDPSDRLHQLDWLRVIAIGVLILFHIGMVYVPGWGFHYKRETQALELQNLMLVLSPWRMGLLWFISGVALRFMWIKHSGIGLLLKRSIQLLFPLLIGVLIVVPPQLYIEMKQAGKMSLCSTLMIIKVGSGPISTLITYGFYARCGNTVSSCYC
jgi:uncharacterized membrane protein